MTAAPIGNYIEPTPALKWAGGKTELLPEICAALPLKMRRYYEPMVGGGAALLKLAAYCRFEEARAADNNPDVINFYRVLQSQPHKLIAAVALLAPRAKDEAFYYEIRAQKIADLSDVEAAARLLFLNKTCYNGLYRVNKAGQFNVPFGRYAAPRVLNEQNLLAVAAAIRDVEFVCADFETVVADAKPGDGIYFDPPYYPVSETSNFAAYTKEAFNEAEHVRLARVYTRCLKRGVSAVLSNSYAPFVRGLYAYFNTRTVTANRSVNSDSKKRGAVNEILVLGRPVKS